MALPSPVGYEKNSATISTFVLNTLTLKVNIFMLGYSNLLDCYGKCQKFAYDSYWEVEYLTNFSPLI